MAQGVYTCISLAGALFFTRVPGVLKTIETVSSGSTFPFSKIIILLFSGGITYVLQYILCDLVAGRFLPLPRIGSQRHQQ
ncbi:hypothetical protein BDW02DRAFT_9939 [Decorospora gaudefroyi]|uniref:Uncharacterized protein n=1 Tax=Decorospora gaudefroyi TaxID=184978 RepID=A0A6A5KTY8_9PLEO|nr:hypothetical protein BDW02DRAFT_9939 [Decorospora gaudefroyi]